MIGGDSWHRVAIRFLNMQFVRFLAVGILNAAFGYSCFWLLWKAGLDYKLALLCANIAGVLFNFKSTGRLVFNSVDNRRIVRFLIVYAIVYGVNVLMVKAMISTGFKVSLAAALAVPPLAVLGFVLNRAFVFHRD